MTHEIQTHEQHIVNFYIDASRQPLDNATMQGSQVIMTESERQPLHQIIHSLLFDLSHLGHNMTIEKFAHKRLDINTATIRRICLKKGTVGFRYQTAQRIIDNCELLVQRHTEQLSVSS